MITKRKSQAALEFLTTYGWAFIIILSTIGAMTYFGVINPSQFIPERCMFGTDFECRDYRLAITTGTAPSGYNVVDFILVNSLEETIDITGMSVDFPNLKGQAVWFLNGTDDWHPGTVRAFKSVAAPGDNPGFVRDQKHKVKITITYTYHEQGFPHVTEGEIYAKVQEISDINS